MKRVMLGISVVAVLAALVIFTPGIVGNGNSSDDGRRAAGPLWQQPNNLQQNPTQPGVTRTPPKPSPAKPSAATPDAIKKRQAEIEKLRKMYTENGMTPELRKRIEKLRAEQGGLPMVPKMTPEMMKKLEEQREAMRKAASLPPPRPGRAPINVHTNYPPQKSPMDERFGIVLGRVTTSSRVSLTPDALLSIRLLDITDQAEPRVIAEQGVANPGKMPCSFLVWYSKQSVSPKRKYAVQAVVADKGAVRWKTTAECRDVGKGQTTALEIPLRPYKAPEPPAPSVQIGDTPVEFDAGTKPVLADGEWLLPANAILKAAGIEPAYSEADKTLTVAEGEESLTAKLPGRTLVLKDGTKRDLSKALEIRDGSIYAPIDFLQIATHRKALFDRESNTIVLVKM